MSNDLNQCQFIGRLGKDPETRYMPDGKAITSFSIACGSSWKDKNGDKKESTEWINCTAFGKLAEIVGEYIKKGSQIYVSGSLKTDKYEKEGKTMYSTKVVVNNMQMLGTKASQDDAPTATKPKADVPKASNSFGDMEDDVPF
jgi:single-strand DNA-binding protein